jgi:hypothetical protein
MVYCWYWKGSKKIFLIPVPARNSDVMYGILRDFIAPGKTVYTDQWWAYAAAARNFVDLNHLAVNHTLNFVDPFNNDIHTQNVEGICSHSKFFLRSKLGVKQEKHSQLLIQFVWEYSIEKRKRFNEFLKLCQVV